MPRPRSTTTPKTLYRFEGGLDLVDYLVSLTQHDIHENREVRIGEVTGRLVTGRFGSDQPEWAPFIQSITDVAVDLPSALPFAVLLVPMPPWTYAIACGSGHHLLDDQMMEQGFGLMFGIRRLDPDRLGTLARTALDATARHVETSFPGGSDIGGFDLERFGELVNRVGGLADLSGLTYDRDNAKPCRIKTSTSLTVPLARDPRDLLRDLAVIGEIVDRADDDSPLQFIGQIRAVKPGHPRYSELEQRLAEALGGDDRFGPLDVAWPANVVRAADDAYSFAVSGGGGALFAAPLEIGDVLGLLTAVPVEERVAEIARVRVTPCADDAGVEALAAATPLRKWVSFETTIDSVRYCYHHGGWVRIGEGFVEQLHNQVGGLLSRRSALSFPLWTPTGKQNDEHLYCRQAASQLGGIVLDRDLATTPLHKKFELCDLVGPSGEIVHVKWLGGAPAASHLLTQAQVSAESLRFEPEALVEFNRRVAVADPTLVKSDGPTTVVLAAAGRPWNVDRLFSLSQLSLLRLDQRMRRLGLRLEFADIPYVAKRKRSTLAA
ncbi:TIGR04141 family sporadically distributed protein [Saccharothrix australiensis]|uniref:Uncharacterized protein (TIGR04141 family) n=1 Tax=Saccharothrix australiensis TaxID=2072 RepID=A0A495W2T5_9PSEU|nr:TIGR04141 family sporadically distributed protein [Saccharothrix australiensis]RKT54148.1 uncharacterized protein (TIGR04141 family) [Saccharothrix australiensis]